MRKFPIKLILLFVLCCSSLYAAPADLDPTFGDAGKVASSPDGNNKGLAFAMALQPDGKILMGGRIYNTTQHGFLIARYYSNGSLDTTFGSNGFTLVSFNSSPQAATALEVQPNGKIIVGGVTSLSGFSDIAIARLNTDGSLDTTFGSGGKVTIDHESQNDTLSSLKLTDSGKIVFCGKTKINSVSFSTSFVGRLNSDGSMDNSFGTNGKKVDLPNVSWGDLVVESNGSITATGGYINEIPATRIIIAKYNNSGDRLWTYSQTQSSGSLAAVLKAIALQPDGKIVAAGRFEDTIYAIRLNPDGTEDSSFSNGASAIPGYPQSVALQPDGKIVANLQIANGSSFSLVRFNSDGSLDTGFGDNGIVLNNVFSNVFTNTQQVASKTILQPDGKILVGGYITAGVNFVLNKFAMVRYMGEATPTISPTPFDYDGDGKSDIAVYRPSNGAWYVDQSTNGFGAIQFGISTDKIVPADYDGDGKTDYAIFRDGVWWIFQSESNTVKVTQFGTSEDKPQLGDFDGDDIDDIAIFRPSTGEWYVLRSSDGSYFSAQFGSVGDIPQSGDYEGDGNADFAVFRPSNYTWYIKYSSGGLRIQQFGLPDDIPVARNYDGDGKADLAVFRPSDGTWHIITNQLKIQQFGLQGDIPVPADYDGDGKTDIAVFRPSDQVWYQLRSTEGSYAQVWGLSTDKPAQGIYNP